MPNSVFDAVRTVLAAERESQYGLPDSHQVIAVLPFGYPARVLGKGLKQRKPLPRSPPRSSSETHCAEAMTGKRCQSPPPLASSKR